MKRQARRNMVRDGHESLGAGGSLQHPIARLADALAGALDAAAGAQPAAAAELGAFAGQLRELGTQPVSRAPRRPPAVVPALRHLPAALAAVDVASPPALGEATCAAVGHAAWSSYYARSAWSAPFVADLAVGQLAGPGAPHACDGLALGLFLQGPRTNYAPHAHAAAEVYVVVGGQAAFQSGAHAPFRTAAPGSVVLHRSDQAHAIATGDAPLLAVYAWRGDVTAPPWYRRDMAADDEPRRHPPLAD